MEKIGQRMDMINESLPPVVMFTEHEVFSILYEIEGFKSSLNPTEEEINEIYKDKEIVTSKFKIREAFQKALQKKRGHIETGGAPEGAYY